MARRPRLGRWLAWGAGVVFVLVFVASLRWALVVSLSSEVAVHVAAGGLMLQLREQQPAAAPLVPNVRGMPSSRLVRGPAAPPEEHPVLYGYRHHFGFQWWYEAYALPMSTSQSWTVPLWWVFGVIAAWWGGSVVRRRLALKPWECAGCGYDLRGLAGGVCPECGAVVKTSKLAN